LRKAVRVATPSLVQTGRALQKLLRDGPTRHDKVWLINAELSG